MKEEIVAGTFVSRPNRFISYVSIGGEVERCHMPNPGRMWELLYEGTKIWLRKTRIRSGKRNGTSSVSNGMAYLYY